MIFFLVVIGRRRTLMKKTFFPLHIGHIILYLGSAFITGCGIYAVIYGLFCVFKVNNLTGLIAGLIVIMAGAFAMYLSLYILIYLWHNRAIFEDDKIVITGHLIIKNQGQQFPDEIRYDEIQDVAIICANADSLKRRIKSIGPNGSRPYFYYEVILKNGETKWIYIECFSRSQRKKMLDIINSKAGLN